MTADLRIDALSVAYGTRRAVRDVTIAGLRPGTVTALIGPNAAGKSTLMRAIAGLLPSTGAVALGEDDLQRLRIGERAARVRFVPQSYQTSARLTVFDLLLVARMCGGGGAPSDADMAAVDGALRRVGIAHLSDRMALTLSGGQQQLVALAQALTRPAPVLLLDEPTSALDLRHQLEAMAVLRRVAAEDGSIVVAALHDLNLAVRHADRIVLLCEGQVAADGPPAEVLRAEACAEAYGVRLAIAQTGRGTLVAEAYL